MTGARGTRAHGGRIALLLIRIASRLVPGHQRADWLREWTGEVSARVASDGPVLFETLGSLRHAFWLRRQHWYRLVERVRQDLRFGVRALVRRPLFSISAVVTLALGLGATTSVFTIVDAVLFAPLPFPGSDRWVSVGARFDKWDLDLPGLSDELYSEWRERSRAAGFEAFEMYTLSETHLVGAGTPIIGHEARVSPGFLSDILAVHPRPGRLFDASEASGDGPSVAVISERLWRERYGARSDVAGALLRIGGREVTVIGVVPRIDILPDVDVWTPARIDVDHSRTRLGSLRVIGRLAPGVTVAAATTNLRAVNERAAAMFPKSLAPFTPTVTGFRSALVSDVRAHLLLLLGAVAAVLLIACLNVAGLFIGRNVERGHEQAIRTSLGATWRHLVGQVFAESLVLAVIGGVGGIALAVLSVDGMLALIPADIPLSSDVSLDRRVLIFVLLAIMATSILVALLPTLRAARGLPSGHGGRRHSLTRRERRAGGILVGLEVAQATALVVAAALMLNTLVREATAKTGFDPDDLLFVHLDLPDWEFADGSDPTRRATFVETLRKRLRAVPDVRSVGLGSATPFSGMTFMTGVDLEGGRRAGSGNGGIEVLNAGDRVYFSRLHVDPGYLRTLGLPITAGRALTEADAASAEAVGLVNETAARAYWPNESPLGKRLREVDGPWVTIVGVLKDFGHPGLPTHGKAELYLPLSPALLPDLSRPTLLIRHDGRGDAMVDRIRREIWRIDPDLPIVDVASATSELGASLAVPRFYAMLLGSFAVLGLLLAAVGVYGVVAHAVARRTREIGIRMALGAHARSVGVMVVRDNMLVVLVGLAIGLLVGAVASRLLAGLLYGIAPTDPLTYSTVGLLLTLVSLAAVWIPARRAMRADPLVSLRAD